MTKNRFPKVSILFTFAAMGVLILDAKTALHGAQEGIDLCTRTVIPSLFPFFVLSVLLTSSVSIGKGNLLIPIGQLFRIPRGAETILLTGFLGGYPVGAQSIAQAYEEGSLDHRSARRMLGFCSNPGPAFLFGMAGNLFDHIVVPWILWGIIIVSAWLTSLTLPGERKEECTLPPKRAAGLSAALWQAIRSMALVCGWVILFRIVITFLDRWFLWLLPQNTKILITGLLELTNGICSLSYLEDASLRFLLCTVFLSFGGICVAMQTGSLCGKLGTGLYIPGKILQTGFSMILSGLISPILFDHSISMPTVVFSILFLLGILFCKIRSRNPEPVVV